MCKKLIFSPYSPKNEIISFSKSSIFKLLRLIRTPKDKGIFVLLDSRIAKKTMGKNLLVRFQMELILKV